MLHAGLDLSRKRLDYCLLDEDGAQIERGAVAPDADGLVGFARALPAHLDREGGPNARARHGLMLRPSVSCPLRDRLAEHRRWACPASKQVLLVLPR